MKFFDDARPLDFEMTPRLSFFFKLISFLASEQVHSFSPTLSFSSSTLGPFEDPPLTTAVSYPFRHLEEHITLE